MPPKKNEPSKPNASRKRKSDGKDDAPKPLASKKYRKLLPAHAKPRINRDGTTTQVQQYTPGYDPYRSPRDFAAGPSPATKREPFTPPLATPLGCDYERARARVQAAQYPVTDVRRAEDVRPAMLLPNIMGPPPPPSRNGGSSGVPTPWNAGSQQKFQEPKREQGPFQIEPPSIINNNLDEVFRGLNSGSEAELAMPNPSLWPNAAPQQNGYNSAVQAPNTFFSSGLAPALHPSDYNGVVDPSFLPFVPEPPEDYNSMIPVHTTQTFDNMGQNNVAFNFGNLPPQPQQQQPQPPSQDQCTYLHQEGNHTQQPPPYAQLQYPTYTNSYPPQHSYMLQYNTNCLPEQQALSSYTPPYSNVPLQQQQQQPAYTSPYANYPSQQHQPTPQIPPGYSMSYAPPSQFNNVVGNNIFFNHVPSSSSQNITARNTFDTRQQDVQRLRVEVRRGWIKAAEEEKGVLHR